MRSIVAGALVCLVTVGLVATRFAGPPAGYVAAGGTGCHEHRDGPPRAVSTGVWNGFCTAASTDRTRINNAKHYTYQNVRPAANQVCGPGGGFLTMLTLRTMRRALTAVAGCYVWSRIS